MTSTTTKYESAILLKAPTAPPLRDENDAQYIWSRCAKGTYMVRTTTHTERMFVAFNKDLYAQNCPFIGASIRVTASPTTTPSQLTSAVLRERAVTALQHTRFVYPSIAIRIKDTEARYDLDDESGTARWADRNVHLVTEAGGWIRLRERLSRDVALPTKNGDHCSIYLVVRPKDEEGVEAGNEGLQRFDVLMHISHVFVDGAGIRTILSEFLERLAQPFESDEVRWGEEAERLYPPAFMLEKIVKEDKPKQDQAGPEVEEEKKKKGAGWRADYNKPDIGLPHYRPDIIDPPLLSNRGSLFVSHTFPPSFLPTLLTAGRARSLKLTPVLHAALLAAVYTVRTIEPTETDIYRSRSAMDLRNSGHLQKEWCTRRQYVNMAVGAFPFDVPWQVFRDAEAKGNMVAGVWEAAEIIREQWARNVRKGNVAREGEEGCKTLMEGWDPNPSRPSPSEATKPATCPYYISDPPGEQLLRETYDVAGLGTNNVISVNDTNSTNMAKNINSTNSEESEDTTNGTNNMPDASDIKFILESYQLATDQSRACVSARSHSWMGRLVLCLVFNAARNPEESMKEVLGVWVSLVGAVVRGDGSG